MSSPTKSISPRRAPIRLERFRSRVDVLVYLGPKHDEETRVTISLLELLTLQRDVNDAVAGAALNSIMVEEQHG
ncbi:MAG: hypothetical protein P4L82_12195 [Ancalomicrobiaceae bacterium]|nr:hypothetical protein [Ancalomicrobiaceae bacterium]